MRGLESTPRQLALLVGERDQLHGMWESLGPEAQERILRLLASAIARILSQLEER